jgi:hypothetical protein
VPFKCVLTRRYVENDGSVVLPVTGRYERSFINMLTIVMQFLMEAVEQATLGANSDYWQLSGCKLQVDVLVWSTLGINLRSAITSFK